MIDRYNKDKESRVVEIRLHESLNVDDQRIQCRNESSFCLRRLESLGDQLSETFDLLIRFMCYELVHYYRWLTEDIYICMLILWWTWGLLVCGGWYTISVQDLWYHNSSSGSRKGCLWFIKSCVVSDTSGQDDVFGLTLQWLLVYLGNIFLCSRISLIRLLSL